jgi:hypothetical protein
MVVSKQEFLGNREPVRMIVGRSNKAIRAVMIVALMGGGNVQSMQHEHAHGDKAHDHNPTSLQDHAELHEGECSHHHLHDTHEGPANSAAPAGVQQISDSVKHTHLCWFGICFSLPNSHDSDSDTQSERNEPGIVPEVSAATVMAAQSPTLEATYELRQECAGGVPVAAEVTHATFTCIPAIAAPLCDTARHERSGVQLI